MSLPSACFTEVTPRKSPGLMSASATGCVNTISVLSPSPTLVFPSTTKLFPSTAVIVPRTRVWASASFRPMPSASSAAVKNALLRRLDAIFAHRDARRDQLAVVVHARAGEDGFAGLEVGAGAVLESEVLRLRRHQDLLLAVLVLERELVAAAHLRAAFDVGVGHHRVGDRIPRAVHLRHLRPERVHALRHQATIGVLGRGHADVAAGLEVGRRSLLG